MSSHKIPTKREVTIAREEATLVLSKITDLLLRSGAEGFLEFQRALTRECDSEAASSSAPRANPEGLKAVLRGCGVLLSPDEFRSILMGYCDIVGFVLVVPLLAALCPLAQLSSQAEATAYALLPKDNNNAVAAGGGSSSVAATKPLPSVTLDSVHELMCHLFAPAEEGNDALSSEMQSAYEEAAVCFTMENYPNVIVPGGDVITFIGTVLALRASVRGFEPLVVARLIEAKGILLASGTNVATITLGASCATNPMASSSTAVTGFTMMKTGARSTREFERYRDESRLDEWLRGRDEPAARSSYQKRVVGYGGHMPEYRYHFGRTFHVIEEDLPELTKPPKVLEEVTPDAFGSSRELKNSRMNAHHYNFS